MTVTYWPFDSGAGLAVTTTQWSQMERAKAGGFGMSGVMRANNDLYDLQTSRGNNLKVTQAASLTLSVAVGRALVLGHMVNNDAPLSVVLSANSDPSNGRKDRIVAYIDFTTNTAGIKAVAGVASASPAPPDLNRSSTEYQVSLAIVLQAAASGGISTVTDAREYVVLGPPPMVILRRKTNRTIPTTAVTVVRFGETASNTEQGTDYWNTTTTPVRDPDNMHSTTGADSNDTDARITAVVAGWYHVWGMCRWASNATGERVAGITSVKSGTGVAEDEVRVMANTGGETTQRTEALVYLDIGDYAFMTAYQVSGGDLGLVGTDTLGDAASARSRGTMFAARWVCP